MKLTATLSLVLLFTSTPILAQTGGSVTCYSDYPEISDCGLQEVVGQVNSVWVVHGGSYPEGTLARFRIVTDWDAPKLPTDYHGNFVVGDAYTGVEVTYPDYFNPAVPGCVPLPHLLAELRFMPMSPTPCGATVSVVPHPDSGSNMIEVVDCFGDERTADTSVPVLVNGMQVLGDPVSGRNALGVRFCICDVVRTEPSTWGSIKSLYR